MFILLYNDHEIFKRSENRIEMRATSVSYINGFPIPVPQVRQDDDLRMIGVALPEGVFLEPGAMRAINET